MKQARNHKPPEPGTRFWSLVVVECYLRKLDCGSNKMYAKCVCDCGGATDTAVNGLRRGKTMSCGCHQKKRASETSKTHGESRTPLYRVWATMQSRCHNPAVASYKTYGAVGVTVCAEWRASYEAFAAWARPAGYAAGLEIDRIDTKLGYSPTNCRWVPRAVNARNRTDNRFIEREGKRLTVAEWAEVLGMPSGRIYRRLLRGATDAEALRIK